MATRRKKTIEPPKPPQLRGPHVRWMIRRDMAEVLDIEYDRFDFPWLEEDFIRCLRQRNCIGMVVDYDVFDESGMPVDHIAGFMVYELHKTRLHLVNFAVAKRFERIGIGRVMMEKLLGKLSSERRTRVSFEVRETNLDGLLFLRAMGFRAVSVIKDRYKGISEDAYLMEYRYVPKVEEFCAGRGSLSGW